MHRRVAIGLWKVLTLQCVLFLIVMCVCTLVPSGNRGDEMKEMNYMCIHHGVVLVGTTSVLVVSVAQCLLNAPSHVQDLSA